MIWFLYITGFTKRKGGSLAPHCSVQFIVHVIITVVALGSIAAPPGGLHQLSIRTFASVLIQQYIQSLFKYPCLWELNLAQDKTHWQEWMPGQTVVKECSLDLFVKVKATRFLPTWELCIQHVCLGSFLCVLVFAVCLFFGEAIDLSKKNWFILIKNYLTSDTNRKGRAKLKYELFSGSRAPENANLKFLPHTVCKLGYTHHSLDWQPFIIPQTGRQWLCLLLLLVKTTIWLQLFQGKGCYLEPRNSLFLRFI